MKIIKSLPLVLAILSILIIGGIETEKISFSSGIKYSLTFAMAGVAIDTIIKKIEMR